MRSYSKCFRAAAWFVVAGLLMTYTIGCNTVEGVGEDIEAGGDAIEDAAD